MRVGAETASRDEHTRKTLFSHTTPRFHESDRIYY